MQMTLDLLKARLVREPLEGLGVFPDPLFHHPPYHVVALVAQHMGVARARLVRALCLGAVVQPQLEVLKGRGLGQPLVPLRVKVDALRGAPDHTLPAGVVGLGRLARGPNHGLFHGVLVTRQGALLFLSLRVHRLLVVQVGLELCVARVVGKAWVPFGVLDNKRVLGKKDVIVACITGHGSAAVTVCDVLRGVPCLLFLLGQLTRLWAYILLLQVVLDLQQAGLRRKPWVPLWVTRGLLLGVDHVVVARLARFRSMALVCCHSRLPRWFADRTTRLWAAPLTTVQHLPVHEGLEVVERRVL
mmetsp:Transcript_91809/g.259930  ORF Transcript_91809/g.259930 Transcript_91809/m.259930 type:complete len:301 (-) Transcript_91809:441-1343(-)